MTEIRNSILAGLVFGLVCGGMMSLRYNTRIGFITGPIVGVLFGAGLYFFMTSKTVAKQTEIENLDGTPIILSAPANHLKKGEAVGGKLYLLADKLHFKSHGFNIQDHEEIIGIDQIKEVSFYNALGLIPTGLAVTTVDGKTEKFVLGKRKLWKEAIEKLKEGR